MSDTFAIEKLAAKLEQRLGDPTDPASDVSFAAALEHDDWEKYPHSMMAALHACGLQDYQIPEPHGGRADDLQDSFEILRLIGRRDAGLATSFATTSLGMMPVLIGGTDEQKARYVADVSRGAKFAWALSERDHGSDILATDTCARRAEGGYVVNGEKWPIGNSALGDVIALFVRTGDRPGPTSYSVLMVDRRTADGRRVAPMQRERFHGLRALDNGGLRFTECFVPDDALVGGEGRGLELALKASLAVRPMVPALALGCADTALRRTLDFAVSRKIFGASLIDISPSRRRIADCFADIMVCDVVAMSSIRTLHVAPAQCSVTSSVSKFLVPTILERTVSDLATVLGARHFLRSDPHYGSFGKAMRDLWIAHFAEGNTVVNLKNIAVQLGPLLDAALDPPAERVGAAVERASTTYDLDAELPPFVPQLLDLRSRDGDDALIALPAALEEIRIRRGADRPQWLQIADVGDRFMNELRRIQDRHARLRNELGAAAAQSADMFALAEQYCIIHAAADVVQLSLRSAGCLRDPFPNAALVLLCLERLWRRFHPLESLTTSAIRDEAVEVARRLHTEQRLFSQRQLLLGESWGGAAGGGANET